MDIKMESESENITNVSWICCTMYDNAKSIAFASAVKIDALSDNLILDVKLFAKTAAPTLQLSFEPSMKICIKSSCFSLIARNFSLKCSGEFNDILNSPMLAQGERLGSLNVRRPSTLVG
jgi:hypothetical protein